MAISQHIQKINKRKKTVFSSKKLLKLILQILFTFRRRLERYQLRVRLKQNRDRGFIFLLTQAAVQPESDAGSDGVEPASGFI